MCIYIYIYVYKKLVSGADLLPDVCDGWMDGIIYKYKYIYVYMYIHTYIYI